MSRNFGGFIFGCCLLLGSLFYFGISAQGKEGNSNLKNAAAHVLLSDETEVKQRGVHVFGEIDSTNLEPLVENNFEWITLVPFGVQKDFDSAEVIYYKKDSSYINTRDSMWSSQINLARAAGFKIFFKPHIWLTKPSEGKWRSDIYPKNDEDWKIWQDTYREFIMLYAKIAEKNKVEMFCIGAEFTKLTIEKPLYWRKLIQEIRTVYSGQLTYAANWYKEFEKVTFWDELDYIGVQAYFPLVKKDYPTVPQISKGWNKHLPKMSALYEKYNRKILFTEMGYKSTPDSAIKPWEWLDYSATGERSLCYETQANCYAAFFDTVWEKEWFAGVHVWQWRCDYVPTEKREDMDFTPQGKLAVEVIARGFEESH